MSDFSLIREDTKNRMEKTIETLKADFFLKLSDS